MHAGVWFFKVEANDWAQRMAVYRHLKKVGRPKQDDMRTNTSLLLRWVVDMPVLNKSTQSSVTVPFSGIIVPGEDNDLIPVGPHKRV
jgi:hypothetical protein